MNITYLIGNGFDIRLGMPTGYPDFLNYYRQQTIPTNKAAIEWKNLFLKLMEEKQTEEENKWKDLEIALGEFTREFRKKEDFINFYEDLNFSLIEYLKKVDEHCCNITKEDDSEKLIADIISPFSYLNKLERNNCCAKLKLNDHFYINIITFNYTSSFENLCKDSCVCNQWYMQSNSNSYKYIIQNIHHIHQTLNDNGILFGVNNEAQILNEKFRDDEDIQDIILKPKGNRVIGSMIDDACKEIINSSNLICIFGTSLGTTDQIWWDLIGKKFLNNTYVILLCFVYEHIDENKPRLNMGKGSYERKARQEIMNILGIEGKESDYRDRIYITINSNMFPSRTIVPPNDIFEN